MRELEIRSVLAHVCKELDLRARARRSAASAVLGTSLVFTVGCSDDDSQAPVTDASTPTPSTTATATSTSGGTGDLDSGAVAEYMAPAPDAGPVADSGSPDAGAALDGGAVAVYSAPVDSGTVVTDTATATSTDTSDLDSGAVAEYMAPAPDAGVVDPLDGGVVAVYMIQAAT